MFWNSTRSPPIRYCASAAFRCRGLLLGPLPALLHRLLLDVRADLADRVLPGHLGDLRLVKADQRRDRPPELAALLRGRVDVGADVVVVRRDDRQPGRADHGDDRQLGVVDRRGAELVELGRALALLVALDLPLEVPDRRDAREPLAVEEGDPVVARHQAEPRLGPGGDLRDVPLAGDRPGRDEVDVDRRRERLDVDRDVEVGPVIHLVERPLEVERRRPGDRLVAGLQGVERRVDRLERLLALGDRRRGVILLKRLPRARC